MPEMTDAMYCHQQISIPPTFPYILRQYAKNAIRSQPIDLLRWSCAYFRALALGLRPAVKLRLEYPIPRTHYGLTAGWLKTLLVQLGNVKDVSWPQLYDRWRGACLQIHGLQEIILLAGFNDPLRIPWYRFVACAAGHLTTTITNTMILICELLTEEPEGGSAMIPYGIFADLYSFLAGIDACEPREVLNYWFTESNLDLTKVEPAETEAPTEGLGELERSIVSEHSTVSDGMDKSRLSDLRKYLKTIQVAEVEEEDFVVVPKKEEVQVSETPPSEPEPNCYIVLDPEDGKICDSVHTKSTSSSSGSTTEPSLVLEVKSLEIEMEEEGEESLKLPSVISLKESVSSSIGSTEESKEGNIFKLIDVPGIGGVVKDEVVKALLKYMKEMANKQQGMVMPRNIKHFLCPPLEECFS